MTVVVDKTTSWRLTSRGPERAENVAHSHNFVQFVQYFGESLLTSQLFCVNLQLERECAHGSPCATGACAGVRTRHHDLNEQKSLSINFILIL